MSFLGLRRPNLGRLIDHFATKFYCHYDVISLLAYVYPLLSIYVHSTSIGYLLDMSGIKLCPPISYLDIPWTSIINPRDIKRIFYGYLQYPRRMFIGYFSDIRVLFGMSAVNVIFRKNVL